MHCLYYIAALQFFLAELRPAIAKGYKDAEHMKKDLDPLCSRDDFKKLLAELEAKSP